MLFSYSKYLCIMSVHYTSSIPVPFLYMHKYICTGLDLLALLCGTKLEMLILDALL